GLVGLRAGRVGTLAPPDQWQGHALLSISLGQSNCVWITTEGAGIYRLKDTQWEHFGGPEGLSNLFVWAALEDQAGKLWAATWGGGVFIMENGRFSRVKGMENITTPMTALLHAPNNTTWIGSSFGLI